MSGGAEIADKKPKAKRKSPLSVRLSDQQRAELEANAGGMPLGSYIKSIVFADDAPRYRARRKPPVEDQKLLAEILARLGQSRSASNLNQIAKAIHLGTFSVDPHLEADLNRACAEVAWMRLTLMQALGLKPEAEPAKQRPDPKAPSTPPAPKPRKVKIVSSFAKAAGSPVVPAEPVATAPRSMPEPAAPPQQPTPEPAPQPAPASPPSRFQWRPQADASSVVDAKEDSQ